MVETTFGYVLSDYSYELRYSSPAPSVCYKLKGTSLHTKCCSWNTALAFEFFTGTLDFAPTDLLYVL